MDVLYVRICAGNPQLPIYAHRYVRRFMGNPRVVWELNATLQYRMYGPGACSAERIRIEEGRRRLLASGVALAICNTEGLARYAEALGVTHTVVVPLGANPDVFRPDVAPDEGVSRIPGVLNILWCGSDQYWWHDLRSALAAASVLVHDSRFRFYLVGDVGADTLLPPNVVRLGRVDASRMPGIQSAMDVGLALYKEALEPYAYGVSSPREAGSPIKVFEYMASGVPAITNPLSQVADRVFSEGNPGILVGFEAADEIVAALRSLADSPEQLRRMGNEGRRLAMSYYNWSRVARETVEAIARLA
jgi:glycosyltransferase involved in cell wall biosynthesis